MNTHHKQTLLPRLVCLSAGLLSVLSLSGCRAVVVGMSRSEEGRDLLLALTPSFLLAGITWVALAIALGGESEAVKAEWGGEDAFTRHNVVSVGFAVVDLLLGFLDMGFGMAVAEFIIFAIVLCNLGIRQSRAIATAVGIFVSYLIAFSILLAIFS